MAPSSVAERDDRAPWNLPTGVRAADTMTISCIANSLRGEAVSIRRTVDEGRISGCRSSDFESLMERRVMLPPWMGQQLHVDRHSMKHGFYAARFSRALSKSGSERFKTDHMRKVC